MNTDMLYFLKLSNFNQRLFGTQKLKIVKESLVEIGFFYYLYIFITNIGLIVFLISECYTTVNNFHDYEILAISVIVCIGFILLVFSILISAIQNIFIAPKYSKNIFILLLKIEKYLGPLGGNYKKTLIFQHVMYYGIKTSFYIYEIYMWLNFTSSHFYGFYFTSLYHYLTIYFELDVFYLSLEVNIVARYLERINEILLKYYFTKDKYTLQNGILMKFWKNSDANLIKNLNIKKLTLSVKILSEIINNINSCYGMKVFI